MFKKLPKWVEYGAFTLAFIAGIVNAVGLLGFEHQAISHVSGSVTLLGIKAITNTSTALLLLSIIISFMLGSALSGLLLSGGSLKLGRHYDTLLFIEGLLLLTSAYLLKNTFVYGIILTSAACGLQNALATNYSGAVIRTTHLTGIFTDLGLMIGKALKGEQFDTRKCVIFLLIISGFLLGGIVGYILFEYFLVLALLFPAAACFVLSFIYKIYRLRTL
ncbi:YoaK family protein [Pseudoalteromonas sp. Z9A5]|uniref:YoaK family protein n=1 Tax=Pseudoalteromonas sp. Z9A5 TaxID=2686355 RepID=UPI0014086DE1|nr:YoaK family protein [Pseudoalteromonas sp. Z9A5]